MADITQPLSVLIPLIWDERKAQFSLTPRARPLAECRLGREAELPAASPGPPARDWLGRAARLGALYVMTVSPFGRVVVVVVLVVRCHRVQSMVEPPSGCGVVRHWALEAAASAARKGAVTPVEQADSVSPVVKMMHSLSTRTPLSNSPGSLPVPARRTRGRGYLRAA